MVYQVMFRRQAGASWEPYAPHTGDPFGAMRLIQQAGKTHAEVTVLQAADGSALAVLIERLGRGELVGSQSSPVPSLTPTPHIKVENAAQPTPAFESRRWELEQGPGGDHDAPYSFAMPQSQDVVVKWLHLLSKVWRETPSSDDGAAA